MNESLLRDDTLTDNTLTTAEIAHPTRSVQISPTAANGENIQPIQESRQMQRGGDTRDNITSQRTLDPNPLFPDDELHNFRARWDTVQTSFVDEPREAVEQADSLVANVVKRIAEQFSTERAGLEQQWAQGDNVSTEDLRQALRRYRSFFDRLLAF
jgi:hypothetical protein